MKFAFFIITVYAHYLVLTLIKLFDHPYMVLAISLCIAVLGGLLYFFGKEKNTLADIGWGIFTGAITSLVLIFGFLLFMIIAFSG